jgi:hypothetical protein
MKMRNVGSNMTEIKTGKATILFSYNTPVACQDENGLHKTERYWSVTTSRHINKWLNGANAELKPQEFFDNLLEE